MKKRILSFLVFLTLFNFTSTGSFKVPGKIYVADSLKVIEKVYVHSDRDVYYPGEDIWFKVYFIDGVDRLLSNHSNNLHIELISPDKKIIGYRSVRLNEGLGNGDFKLPADLPSGQYRIRAYTNYMRNYADQLFFNKDITIINPTDEAKGITDSIKYVKNSLEISFFPEGGSLVDNVQSIVAFKAVNSLGSGCAASGDVYSSEGVKVAGFNSAHKGMGEFTMTPVSGLSYYALARDSAGDRIKLTLPKSFHEGVVINITENRQNELVITARTNLETLPMLLNQDLMLTVSARGVVFKTVSFRMKTLNSYLKVNTDDLPDGIMMLTLSGTNALPLCERLVYINNSKELKVQLETNRSVYNQRDSVSVRMRLLDSSDINRTAFLSLSAAERSFVNSSSLFPSTISSWFLLESDVRGPIEEPSYYFDTSIPGRLKNLDLLLLTQGWRDFEWKYQTNYLPENGFDITGRVRRKFADVPVRDARVNICIFHKGKPIIAWAPTDSSGRFSFKGIDLTGEGKLIASATAGTEDKFQGWLLLDSLKYLPPEVKGNGIRNRQALSQTNSDKEVQTSQSPLPFKEYYRSFIKYAEIKRSIQNRYKLSDTIKPGEVNIIAERNNPESGISRAQRNLGTLKIDQTEIITSEHEKYGSVQQLMTVKFHINSIGGEIMSHQGGMVFLFDGMPMSYEEIAILPISIIERIDIIRNYGPKGKNEAISFTSKNNWGSTPAPSYYSANVKFSGYSEPRIFYSPKHHTTLQSDYKPDLRTTLYWEPNLSLSRSDNVDLKFFNADRSGTIKISVEGITSDGIPVVAGTEYTVK